MFELSQQHKHFLHWGEKEREVMNIIHSPLEEEIHEHQDLDKLSSRIITIMLELHAVLKLYQV